METSLACRQEQFIQHWGSQHTSTHECGPPSKEQYTAARLGQRIAHKLGKKWKLQKGPAEKKVCPRRERWDCEVGKVGCQTMGIVPWSKIHGGKKSSKSLIGAQIHQQVSHKVEKDSTPPSSTFIYLSCVQVSDATGACWEGRFFDWLNRGCLGWGWLMTLSSVDIPIYSRSFALILFWSLE